MYFFKAFVIAFTSDFIPKLYYSMYKDNTMKGYVNDSLSYFDIRNDIDFLHKFSNLTIACRYRDYRKPPCSLYPGDLKCDNDYGREDRWWMILSFRLIFVLVFEVSVFF